MRKFSLLILICFFISACSSNNSKTYSGQTINLTNIVDASTGLNSLVQNIDVVQLEETPSIIGEIDKIIVSSNNIYALDRFRSKSLTVFTLDGKYKTAVNYVGRGPGEFVGLDYFDVDPNTNEIVILDSNQRKLIFYNEEGKFLREMPFGFHAGSFILTNENSILLYSSNNIFNTAEKYSLTLIDRENGDVLDRFFQVDENLENHNFDPYSPLYKLNDTIIFQPSFQPNLYSISNGNVEMRYHFDFGNFWPSESILEQNKNNHNAMQYMNLLAEAGYVMFLNIIEGEKYICVSFSRDEKSYVTFIDKKTHSHKTFNLENESVNAPISSYNESFISIKYDNEKNPTLIFFTLKETLN